MTVASFELLVRHLLTLKNRPVVINMDYYTIVPLSTDRRFPLHSPVVDYYSLPSLNFFTAGDDEFLIKEPHPFWYFHQIVSDYMAYVWRRQMELTCQMISEEAKEGANGENDNEVAISHRPAELPPRMPSLSRYTGYFQTCPKPSTVLKAEYFNLHSRNEEFKFNRIMAVVVAPFQSNRVHLLNASLNHHNWQIQGEEDKKWGWYIDSLIGGQISFRIQIPNVRHAMIDVGYLRSWNRAGHLDERCWVRASEDSCRQDSSWRLPATRWS
jgi:hypothetical protein